jgi:hypothetical protein
MSNEGISGSGSVQSLPPSKEPKPKSLFVRILVKLGEGFMKVITLGQWKKKTTVGPAKPGVAARTESAAGAALMATWGKKPLDRAYNVLSNLDEKKSLDDFRAVAQTILDEASKISENDKEKIHPVVVKFFDACHKRLAELQGGQEKDEFLNFCAQIADQMETIYRQVGSLKGQFFNKEIITNTVNSLSQESSLEDFLRAKKLLIEKAPKLEKSDKENLGIEYLEKLFKKFDRPNADKESIKKYALEVIQQFSEDQLIPEHVAYLYRENFEPMK